MIILQIISNLLHRVSDGNDSMMMTPRSLNDDDPKISLSPNGGRSMDHQTLPHFHCRPAVTIVPTYSTLHCTYIMYIHYVQRDSMNGKWNTFNKTQWLKIVTVFQCDLKPRTKAVHPKLRDNCTHYKRWCCICICVCICMTVYKKLNVLHLQWPAPPSWRATGNKRWGCLPLHAYYPPPYHTSAQTPL